MNQNKIGNFICKLRHDKKITQTELANSLNVNVKTISKWEKGMSLPEPSLYDEICEFFNISKEELLNGKRKSKNINNCMMLIFYILLTSIICYFIFNKNVYEIKLESTPDSIQGYNGIVVDGLFLDNINFNIFFNKPNSYKTVGLYYKDNNKYRIIVSQGNTNTMDDLTSYPILYESYSFKNRYKDEDNIVGNILKHKNELYLCMAYNENEVDNPYDCYKMSIK